MNSDQTTLTPEGVHPEAAVDTKIMVLRVPPVPKKPCLEQIMGPGAPQKFRLNKPEMLLGRDEAADIRLVSGNVSRRHALIRCRNEEICLRDFESRNGVFLNGIKVHSAVLRGGDIIQLGDMVFEFFEDE